MFKKNLTTIIIITIALLLIAIIMIVFNHRIEQIEMHTPKKTIANTQHPAEYSFVKYKHRPPAASHQSASYTEASLSTCGEGTRVRSKQLIMPYYLSFIFNAKTNCMRIFFALPALMLCLYCTAQTNTAPELHLNYLTVKDGLPDGSAMAILQDKEGYTWMGTQDGLVRYDGYKPKTYILGQDIPYKKNVRVLYEDKSGTLWAGTGLQGLFYYDRGKDKFIHVVSTIKSDSLSSAIVYTIQEDASGNLWVGTLISKSLTDYSGASRVCFLINIKTKKYRRFDITKTGGGFSQLSEDKNGSVWFGSRNGIYNYDYSRNKFTTYYTASDSSKKRYFMNAVQDPVQANFIWMSYGNTLSNEPIGLCRFNTADKSIAIYKHEAKDTNSISGNNISAIITDSAHRLWLATENGLSLYNSGNNNFSNYILKDDYKNTGGDSIYDLKQDKEDNFWCSTASGLLYFNTTTKSFTRYTASEKQEDGLLGNYIYNTLIDRNNTLWLGANQLGLQWVNKSKSRYTVYKSNPAQLHHFPGGGVNAFAETPDGSFWLAADHGLYHWLPQTDSFAIIKLDKTQSSDVTVWAVAIDKTGWVWCGVPDNNTNVKGLYGYNPANGMIKNYRNKASDTASLPANTIYFLLSDHTGLLWMGTGNKGICYFNKQSQKFTAFGFKRNEDNKIRVSDKLDDFFVGSIYEDRKGNIWIGTNGGGLNKYSRQANSFTSFQNYNAGLVCPVAIYEDNKGRLWAGSFAGYLFQFDESMQSFKTVAKSNLITGIQQDGYNNLWVYSMNGISLLDTNKDRLRNLPEIPGIPYGGPIFKTSGGLFFLGIKGGFITLNPNAFLPDTTVPVMHIENVAFKLPQKNSMYYKDSSIARYGKNEINLRYNENRVTFSYVGLLYQNTALIQYAYKLDGYDKDWIEAGAQRTVTYTNLSPGTYTFHVKAANSDGVWATKEDTITVIISPPWWQTWWFYILSVISMIAVVYFIVQKQSRNLKKQNIVLEEKVQGRTKELKHSLEELKSTQAQLIQSEKMASLGELTAGIAHEIQNPLNFVNNFSEVSNELVDEMKEELATGNLQLVTEIADDIKQNLEKINHHGKRADSIVKGMLQHSRTSRGQKEPTDINALCDEYLRLAYHGLRAKDKEFNTEIKTDFDESIGKINIVPQDVGRVLLNLINNAFYAVNERCKAEGRRQKAESGTYVPTVTVVTKKLNDKIEIKVEDNGNGIPKNIVDKIFQPFFTTKPTGSGTGLGLSLSYDIIKAHGGEINVKATEGEGSEFTIRLPVNK
ncbi:MAG TPA: two-component regulator propeller domain-containing protein [Parafilimonas sp.]|nr:two-component regulator propeller domain-containing protein [Parafilimonas sp.]